MKENASAALLFASDRGLFDLSSPAGWRYFNACPIAGAAPGLVQKLECEQGNRSVFDRLKADGYRVVPEFDTVSAPCDAAIVRVGRAKQKNLDMLNRAWNGLKMGGALVVFGAKTAGTNSLRKWISQTVDVAGSISKHHCIVFMVQKTAAALQNQPTAAEQKGGYSIARGAFSADGPDPGSTLLAECFDQRICGRAADFGAGWGYLSSELVMRSPGVSEIVLYEVEYSALESARQNLSGIRSAKFEFHWCDLLAEQFVASFDWVVMNPPFHRERTADPALGISFIRQAANAIAPGGRLLLVANRKLPYEAQLREYFRTSSVLKEESGYKVIEAAR